MKWLSCWSQAASKLWCFQVSNGIFAIRSNLASLRGMLKTLIMTFLKTQVTSSPNFWLALSVRIHVLQPPSQSLQQGIYSEMQVEWSKLFWLLYLYEKRAPLLHANSVRITKGHAQFNSLTINSIQSPLASIRVYETSECYTAIIVLGVCSCLAWHVSAISCWLHFMLFGFPYRLCIAMRPQTILAKDIPRHSDIKTVSATYILDQSMMLFKLESGFNCEGHKTGNSWLASKSFGNQQRVQQRDDERLSCCTSRVHVKPSCNNARAL